MASLILVDGREGRVHAQVAGRASEYTTTHGVNHIVCNLESHEHNIYIAVYKKRNFSGTGESVLVSGDIQMRAGVLISERPD